MSLTTNLYFFRPDDDAPYLHRRDVMDAIVGRLPEFEWRQRIAERGALRVAMNEFAWLSDQKGIDTLFDPPVHAFTVAFRRIGDAPVYLNPLDLLRRFHARGWIPEEQHAGLPPAALEPPAEDDAISLDRVLARFQPSGPTPASPTDRPRAPAHLGSRRPPRRRALQPVHQPRHRERQAGLERLAHLRREAVDRQQPARQVPDAHARRVDPLAQRLRPRFARAGQQPPQRPDARGLVAVRNGVEQGEVEVEGAALGGCRLGPPVPSSGSGAHPRRTNWRAISSTVATQIPLSS